MPEHTLRGARCLVLLAALLVACAPRGVAVAPERTGTAVVSDPTPCALPPIVVPTPPAKVPGYTELDPATGLHVTGKAPRVDLSSYRLEIVGNVERPLGLTYDDLRCMRKVQVRCTLVCPGFFQDEATWAGTPLADVLALAGMRPNTAGLRLVSADGYATLVTLPVARFEQSILAYEWEGEPLPILHGFPVRAVFPELSGSFWAKWLVKIEVLGSDEMVSGSRGVDPGDLAPQ